MSDVVIRWEIDEVSKLTEDAKESPIKFIDGLPWRIIVFKESSERTGNEPCLGIYLVCADETESVLWSAEAEFALTVFNSESGKDLTGEYKATFDVDLDNYGIFEIIDFETLLDKEKGFIKDDRIVVEARIKKLELSGMTKPLGLDFSVPRIGNDSIGLIIEGEKVHVNKNSAKTCYTLAVLNADPDKNFVNKYERSFNRNATNWGASKFLSLEDVLDVEKGFIKDDRIVVEAQFTVFNVKGVVKPLEFDFSSPTSGSDNVALIIEGERVHVSKNYLATHSPVFHAMFFGEFAEKNKEGIELKGISRDEFIELLYVIYPSNRPITNNSVGFILALADLYQIKYATNQAENYILRTSKITTAAKLLLSDKYRLEVLQDHCLTSLMDQKSIKALANEPEFKQFSLEIQSNLLRKMIEFVK